EKPEDRGLKSLADQDDQVASAAGEDQLSSRDRYLRVLKSWRLYATGVSIGCQNAARYALIVWVPVHLLGPQWKTTESSISPVWVTLALPIGMALGALSNGWVSDRIFKSRRYLAIISYMCAACVLAVAMMYTHQGSVLGAVLMFFCGFFVF